MYFDVEVEHTWMRMRFGEHYASLSRGGLDPDRLRLYQLCMHLDLVAGPLRIAGTSHPQREWFMGLAEHHLQRALQYPGLEGGWVIVELLAPRNPQPGWQSGWLLVSSSSSVCGGNPVRPGPL